MLWITHNNPSIKLKWQEETQGPACACPHTFKQSDLPTHASFSAHLGGMVWPAAAPGVLQDGSFLLCAAMSRRSATLPSALAAAVQGRLWDILLPSPLFYCHFQEVISPDSVTHTARIHMIHYLSVAITRCCYPTDHNFSSVWENGEWLLNIQYPSAHVGLIEWLAKVICFRNLINPFWPSKEDFVHAQPLTLTHTHRLLEISSFWVCFSDFYTFGWINLHRRVFQFFTECTCEFPASTRTVGIVDPSARLAGPRLPHSFLLSVRGSSCFSLAVKVPHFVLMVNI